MAILIPCQEFLHSRVSYDPETGIMRWKVQVSNVIPGQLAGNKGRNYMKIVFDRRTYIFARVIYVYMTGKQIPDGMFMNHINGDWTDNRWCNLRLATPAENAANVGQRIKKKLPKGVTTHIKNGEIKGYRAYAKGKYLGVFSTIEEARQMYEHISSEVFGEFACLNR